MRSYILAIAVSMLLAAVYAFQNTSEIMVRFLMFQRAFPQGVWEVILFSIGAVLMWFFSILASLETHTTHRKEVRDRDKRISELEEERSSLLNAFKHLPKAPEFAVPAAESAGSLESVDEFVSEHPEDEVESPKEETWEEKESNSI